MTTLIKGLKLNHPLIQSHNYPNLYQKSLSILPNLDKKNHEDILHDVLLNILEKNNYNAEKSSLSTFVCLKTKLKNIDNNRSKSAPVKRKFEQIYRTEAVYHTKFDKARDFAPLVPKEYRSLYNMWIKNDSIKDMASALNIPEGTIKSRVNTLVGHLKKIIKTPDDIYQ